MVIQSSVRIKDLKSYYSFFALSATDPVHTKPEEFENGSFTLKTHQMLFDPATPEEFKKMQQSQVILVCVSGKFGQGNHIII